MYRDFDKPFTFDRVVRLLITTFLICFGIYVVYVLKGVLLPFLLAWLMAYMLNPVVRFFQKRLYLRNRILAVVATLLSVVGIFTLIIILLIPLIEKEFSQINKLIYNYQFRSIDVALSEVPVPIQEFIHKYIDYNSFQNVLDSKTAKGTVMEYLGPTLSGVVSSTISIILGLAVVFLVLLYLIFILIDYDKINTLWANLIPQKYRAFVNKITLDIERNMNTYFRHQFIICLILSVLYSIGFQSIGLPLAIMFGIFVGLLHMIPYLQVVSFIPAILLCWLKVSQTNTNLWVLLGLVLLVYLIVQCIMDLILVPKIMGKAMGLNPAIILLSLSIWGYLLGIVGMIIAIPLTTLLLSYYHAFIDSMADPIEEEMTIAEDKAEKLEE